MALALLTHVAFSILPLPQYLTINNTTSVQSNAYVAGVYPSSVPSNPKEVNLVPWFVVRMACIHHSNGKQCPATIKMATNTPNPIDLADLQLNLETGEITVLRLYPTHYKLTVDGFAQVTLSE